MNNEERIEELEKQNKAFQLELENNKLIIKYISNILVELKAAVDKEDLNEVHDKVIGQIETFWDKE